MWARAPAVEQQHHHLAAVPPPPAAQRRPSPSSRLPAAPTCAIAASTSEYVVISSMTADASPAPAPPPFPAHSSSPPSPRPTRSALRDSAAGCAPAGASAGTNCRCPAWPARTMSIILARISAYWSESRSRPPPGPRAMALTRIRRSAASTSAMSAAAVFSSLAMRARSAVVSAGVPSCAASVSSDLPVELSIHTRCARADVSSPAEGGPPREPPRWPEAAASKAMSEGAPRGRRDWEGVQRWPDEGMAPRLNDHRRST